MDSECLGDVRVVIGERKLQWDGDLQEQSLVISVQWEPGVSFLICNCGIEFIDGFIMHESMF